MHVLWLVRDNLERHPGGDTTQIRETARALRERGVRIEMSSDTRPDFRGYDLVHLFHLDRLWENVPHCRGIAAFGIPAVLSSIYWPADEFDQHGRGGAQGLFSRTLGRRAYQNARLIQRWLIKTARDPRPSRWTRPVASFARSAAFVLQTVRGLLPNSRAEAEQIERRFGVRRPTVIVPNAADAATFAAHGPSSTERAGVLCVGRIEPRKNQLALIRALRDTDARLTLVGPAGRFSGAYARRCAREGGSRVRILGPRTASELGALYRAARVHACVSWYETPGLASLEAALCGCAIVATPGGSTREYLGDEAYYCQPADVDSIRAAVMDALKAGPRPSLAARITSEFTWQAAAEKTLEGYQLALKSATPPDAPP